MKRAFTLLELLVVIGIMGLLGTASIGGYRAVTRGMEERGAVDNASRFVHAAFQRSLIDRQPVAVYYWNETIKGETADDNAIVVGKAVAVRRAGRISRARGSYIYDEFADLNLTYPTNSASSAGSSVASMYLYPMDSVSDTSFERSRVATFVVSAQDAGQNVQEIDPLGESDETMPNGLTAPSDYNPVTIAIPMYGFEVFDGYSGWQRGDAYGFEFQYLTLPHNYIFGTQFSSSMDDPVPTSSQGKMIFGGGAGGYSQRGNNVRGTKTIEVCALRPNASGSLTAVKVGKTKDPTQTE